MRVTDSRPRPAPTRHDEETSHGDHSIRLVVEPDRRFERAGAVYEESGQRVIVFSQTDGVLTPSVR